MKIPFSTILCLTATLALFLVSGCNRQPQPPPPLAVEQIPTEMQKAFTQATPQVKEMVTKLTASLQEKDYSMAYQGVQYLTSLPELTEEQRELTSRAMLTIYGLLQAAQAQGDQTAATTLKVHQATK
ncbi:MAG TPA: hypothetical protein VEC99_13760 [Clostridia bacterium]|nr:hypothetical protein [Clostridia bacterium]